MEIVAKLGIVLIMVGALWCVVVAFRTNVLWGLACLAVPPVQWLFTAAHWSEARRSFWCVILGCALALPYALARG